MEEWKWEAILCDVERSVVQQYPIDGSNENTTKIVFEEEKRDNLAVFLITPRILKTEREFIAVDLTNGLFIVNDQYMDLCPEYLRKRKDIVYRLVFYRRVTVSINDGKAENVTYLIGWQTTFEKENIQRILFYNPDTKIAELREKR